MSEIAQEDKQSKQRSRLRRCPAFNRFKQFIASFLVVETFFFEIKTIIKTIKTI